MQDLRSNSYAVIIAGGKGERFWPQSRVSHPKQLLRLLGNISLIEQTVERLHMTFEYDHIFIITTQDYVAPIQSMLSKLPQGNVISEPCGRDTAPCIMLAAACIKKIAGKDVDPVLSFFPSDHIIRDAETFSARLSECMQYAAENAGIATIGIRPTFPCTGYGYIRTGEQIAGAGFYKSMQFSEKPTLEVAEEYLKAGNYLWNSGMFIFRHSTLLQVMQERIPDLYAFYNMLENNVVSGNANALNEAYQSAEKISFDYAVMEKADNVAVAEGDFGWDDIGSWTSMRNQLLTEEGGNAVLGLHAGLDTENCVIVGEGDHLIATIGIRDMVVVHTEDATLVCDAKSAQRVKELVQLLASKPEMEQFL